MPILNDFRPVAFQVLWFLTGLALGCFLISVAKTSPFPDDPEVQAKASRFLSTKDQVDAMFFGSSRIFRGISPEVFDDQMKSHGRSMTSFNFGFRGMLAHETNAMIETIVEQKPERLKWAFIELRHWGPDLADENRYTARSIFWHNPQETFSVLKSVRLKPFPFARGVNAKGITKVLKTFLWEMKKRAFVAKLSGTHLFHLGAKYANVGLIHSLFAASELSFSEGQALIDHQGFVSLDTAILLDPSYGDRREQFQENLEGYRRSVDSLRKTNKGDRTYGIPKNYNLDALRRQIQRLRFAGVTPVFVIPPLQKPAFFLLDLAKEEDGTILFNFNDPDAYPDLYEIENRFDADHLNQEGAEKFSGALADRFAEYLSSLSDPD